MIRTNRLTWGWVLLIGGTPAQANDDISLPLTIRLVRPGEQVDQLNALFRGTRARNPAEALASYTQARNGRHELGKGAEAIISLFNPRTANELKALDLARFEILGFEPGSGRPRWRAFLPGDDGSLAALATSLALTDGGQSEPIGDVPVLRLGGPGSAVAASLPGGLVLASGRDELREALPLLRQGGSLATGPSGMTAACHLLSLNRSTDLTVRRVAVALDALGYEPFFSRLRLDDGTLTLKVDTDRKRASPPLPRVEASWLDVVPASGVVGAFAVAVDPTPATIDAAFALLDRVEKADPAYAKVAPLRTRVNLLAAVARARPESDVWPKLRGVSGFVRPDAQGRLAGAVVLHMADVESAARFVSDFLPALASTYFKAKGKGVDWRVVVNGRELRAKAEGPRAWVAFGEGTLEAGLKASADPAQSAGAILRTGGKALPNRAGAFWPGRWGRSASMSPELARVLEEAPPVIWRGGERDGTPHDDLAWSGLHDMVRRVLDALPLETPPDRSP